MNATAQGCAWAAGAALRLLRSQTSPLACGVDGLLGRSVPALGACCCTTSNDAWRVAASTGGPPRARVYATTTGGAVGGAGGDGDAVARRALKYGQRLATAPTRPSPKDRCAPPLEPRRSRRPDGHDALAIANTTAQSQLSDAELMAAVRAAARLSDLERLLLDHHAAFRHNHVAAALAKLPSLGASALNRAQRVSRAAQLLGVALLRCAPRLDAHQLAGCVVALARLGGAAAAAAPALDAALAALVCGDPGAELARRLNPDEVAALAQALGALERMTLPANGRGGGLAALPSPSSPPRSQSSRSPSFLAAAAPSGQLAAAAADDDSADEEEDSASSLPAATGNKNSNKNTNNALAHAPAAAQLWALLAGALRHRTDDFTVPDLALALWAFAHSGRADAALLDAAARSVLARPQKLDAPSTARLLAALGAAGRRHPTLLPELVAAVARLKAEFSPPQAGAMLRAFAGLRVSAAAAAAAAATDGAAAVLALCKVASARLAKYERPGDALALVDALAALRFRDAPLLDAFAGALPRWAPGLAAHQLAAALGALAELGHVGSTRAAAAASAVLAELVRPERAAELAPRDAATALWAGALLLLPPADTQRGSVDGGGGGIDARVLHALLAALQRRPPPRAVGEGGVEALPPALEDDEHALVRLYQAHRLLTDGWLTASGGDEVAAAAAAAATTAAEGGGGAPDAAAFIEPAVAAAWTPPVDAQRARVGRRRHGAQHDDDYDDDGSEGSGGSAFASLLRLGGGDSSSGALCFHDAGAGAAALPGELLERSWPEALVEAGRRAAARRVRASTARARRGAGGAGEVRGQVRHVADVLEGAGLVPAVGVALDGGALAVDLAVVLPRRTGTAVAAAASEDGGSVVALMCDTPSRCTANGPHSPTGFWLAAGRALERSGVRVARLPAAEWAALGDAESRLMHVHNALLLLSSD